MPTRLVNTYGPTETTVSSQGCSLRHFVPPRGQSLQANRDAMLAALDKFFPQQASWCVGISWNRPAGGFFLTLTLPRAVGNDELLHCAAEHGVTWTPMPYFLLGSTSSRQIRLPFSHVTPQEVREGIERLASWAQRLVCTS